MDIQQAFNVAYVKSLPGELYEVNQKMTSQSTTALFALEEVGGVLSINNRLTQEERSRRFLAAIDKGYGPILVARIANIGDDPYTVFKTLSDDGVKWMPPAALPAAQPATNPTGIQPELGQPGQFALPNAFEPGIHTGAFPDQKPDNWISVPPVAQLLVDGANVPALLHSWFGGNA